MSLDWTDIFKTLGSTVVVVAAISWLTKQTITHFYLVDLEARKVEFSKELEATKASFSNELEAYKAALKAEYDQQLARFQADLGIAVASIDRRRQEIVRWANPVLTAIEELQRRLDNILLSDGWLALSKENENRINPNWSISYDYFLPSTIYLFGQYFCVSRLLQESVSLELFRTHTEKDAFFKRLHESGRKLSGFPLHQLADLPADGDRQIFTLQQRALGEAMVVREGGTTRCMSYEEFLRKSSDDTFKTLLDPVTRFMSGLEPKHQRRWKRLLLLKGDLEELLTECKRLLTLAQSPPASP